MRTRLPGATPVSRVPRHTARLRPVHASRSFGRPPPRGGSVFPWSFATPLPGPTTSNSFARIRVNVGSQWLSGGGMGERSNPGLRVIGGVTYHYTTRHLVVGRCVRSKKRRLMPEHRFFLYHVRSQIILIYLRRNVAVVSGYAHKIG